MRNVRSLWRPQFHRPLGARRAVLLLTRCLCVVLSIAWVASGAHAERVVTVFAASSLAEAMTRLGDSYTDRTGVRVRFSFAASSTLARQIEAGAPAQIYISANDAWMDYLAAKGLTAPATQRNPIRNVLVLVAPRGSALGAVSLSGETNIAALLGADGWLATGDPDHVPAGIYARQALQALGQWPLLRDRLARSDNVRAALALVARGEARLGIVYATDAKISDAVKIIASFPTSSHEPITYSFAIVAGHDGGDVRHLFDYLTGPEGLKMFRQFGFMSE